MPLAKIDQAMIERTARALYPNASLATRNRQAFTPIAAVLNHAAERGLCACELIERPEQLKGRIRWLTFEEAERLLDACSPHLRPLVMFLLGTGARLSEALYLEWREADLPRVHHVVFLDTKNGYRVASRCIPPCWPNSAPCVAARGPCLGPIRASPAFRGACRRAG